MTALRLPSRPLLAGAGLFALVACVIGLCSGAAGVGAAQVLDVALGHGSVLARSVVLDLRLPRVLAGLLIGASLASCGGGVQALFRNPLAEPGLIGISAGAAVGAALVLTLAPHSQQTAWTLPLAAFAGAAICAAGISALAAGEDGMRIATLLLAGLALNAVAGAAVALLSTLADDGALRSLSLWLFGSLDRVGWHTLAVAAPFLTLPCVWLPVRAGALDALLLGEPEAGHLGVPVARLKRELLLTVVLGTGAAVAISGLIGFIGLLIPHLVRLLAGPRHAAVLSVGALLGGGLLVMADTVARTAFAPMELPVGVLTALLGGPGFLWLLLRARRRIVLP